MDIADLLAHSILEELKHKEKPSAESDSKTRAKPSDSNHKHKRHKHKDRRDRDSKHKHKKKKSSRDEGDKRKSKHKSSRSAAEKSSSKSSSKSSFNRSCDKDETKSDANDNATASAVSQPAAVSDVSDAVTDKLVSNDEASLVVVDDRNRSLDKSGAAQDENAIKAPGNGNEPNCSQAKPKPIATANPPIALPTLTNDDEDLGNTSQIATDKSQIIGDVSSDVAHAIDNPAQPKRTSRQKHEKREKSKSKDDEKAKKKKIKITDDVVENMDRKMEKVERRIKGKSHHSRRSDFSEPKETSRSSKKERDRGYYHRDRSRSRSYSPPRPLYRARSEERYVIECKCESPTVLF